MLIDIIVILLTNTGFEWVFEKINQSKYEPFEKIQANFRYMKNKKICNYIVLFVVVSIGALGAITLGVHRIVTDLWIGFLIACVNTLFENTLFDQMRNTLR